MKKFARPLVGKCKGQTLEILGYSYYSKGRIESYSIRRAKNIPMPFINLKNPWGRSWPLCYKIGNVSILLEKDESTKSSLQEKVDKDLFLVYDLNERIVPVTQSNITNALSTAEEWLKDEYEGLEDGEKIYIYKLVKKVSKNTVSKVEITIEDIK